MISNQFDSLFTIDKIIQHKREQDFGLCGVLKILNGYNKILYLYYILQLLVHALRTVFLFLLTFIIYNIFNNKSIILSWYILINKVHYIITWNFAYVY